LVVAVLLPLFSGQTILASFGPLNLRLEGFLAMLIMVTKSLSILTVSLVLFSSAPFLTSLKAIRALGLPSILADMMLLSYRYFFEIGQDFSKMEIAMQVRGFQLKAYDRRSLQSMAALAGSLLVRSYERSERVYKAMLLRGYGQAPSSKASEEFQARPPDLMATALVVVVALGLVLAQLSLGGLVIY
jgi:cobalt/nickel transport system permease protein